MLVYGVVPYRTFKERIKIVNELKQENKNIKIMINDELIHYVYKYK